MGEGSFGDVAEGGLRSPDCSFSSLWWRLPLRPLSKCSLPPSAESLALQFYLPPSHTPPALGPGVAPLPCPLTAVCGSNVFNYRWEQRYKPPEGLTFPRMPHPPRLLSELIYQQPISHRRIGGTAGLTAKYTRQTGRGQGADSLWFIRP